MSPGGISLKPSDATQGGGLLDDADVTLNKLRAVLWDYNGALKSPVVALEVQMDAGEQGQVTQYYSAGDPKHFVPSEDGKRFVPVGTATGINENTNAMAFLVSLVNAGFPEDKIGDDVSVFEGAEVHVARVPQPKRPGLAGQADNQNKTVLVVKKINKLPWDKKGKSNPKAVGASTPLATTGPASSTAGTGVSTQTSPGVVEANPDMVTKAVDGLLAILAGKGGQIAKAQIAQEAFKHYQKDPERNQLVKLMYSDDFLGQDNAPWSFDGATVKLG